MDKNRHFWTTYQPLLFHIVKVHIFWEGHKILRNLHLTFDWQYIGQIIGGDFAKFCGLLRIYELYYKFPASKNWFLYLHQNRFLKDIFTWLSILLRLECGKHSFLMMKTHYLTQKFHKWQHLIKKNVAVFLRQQLAVSKSTDLIMKLIVATCENQGWELRIVTDRFFFLLFLYFSFFFFPKKTKISDSKWVEINYERALLFARDYHYWLEGVNLIIFWSRAAAVLQIWSANC